MKIGILSLLKKHFFLKLTMDLALQRKTIESNSIKPAAVAALISLPFSRN